MYQLIKQSNPFANPIVISKFMSPNIAGFFSKRLQNLAIMSNSYNIFFVNEVNL